MNGFYTYELTCILYTLCIEALLCYLLVSRHACEDFLSSPLPFLSPIKHGVILILCVLIQVHNADPCDNSIVGYSVYFKNINNTHTYIYI